MARSIPKIGSRKTGRIGSRKHPGKIPKGHIFIQSSFNNTIVTVTDVRGRVISWSSAGSCGFKGKRRGTPAQGDLTPWSWSLLGGPCTFVAVYGLFELIGFMLRQFGFLDFMLRQFGFLDFMLRRQFQFLRLQYGPSYAIAFDLFLILAVFVTGIIFSPILNNILISNYREIRKRILLFLQKILLIFLDRVDEIAVSYLKYSLKYRRIININLNQKKKKRIVPTFKIRQARTSYGRLACLIIITDKARDLYFTPQGQKDFLLDTPEWLEKMDYRGRIHYDLTPPPQHNERFNLILTQLNDQFNKYLNWSTIIIKRIIKKGRGWVLILNNWVVDLALWIEKKEIKRRIRKHFEQLQHFIQLLFQSIFNFFKKLK